jgi:hypothetical protein
MTGTHDNGRPHQTKLVQELHMSLTHRSLVAGAPLGRVRHLRNRGRAAHFDPGMEEIHGLYPRKTANTASEHWSCVMLYSL